MTQVYDLLIVGHDDKGILVPLGEPEAQDWLTRLAGKWANAKYFQIQPKQGGPPMPIVRVNVGGHLREPVYFIRTQQKINAATNEVLATRRFYNVGWIDGDVVVLTTVGPYGNICTEQLCREDLPEHYQLEHHQLEKQEA